MIPILIGLKSIGIINFIIYVLFWLIIIDYINGTIYSEIETLLNREHKTYWYDVLTKIIYVYLFIYGIYIYGKYNI